MDPKALVPYDVKLMPLADLKDHPANPRTIRDTALKGLLASIERFGLIEPIIWNQRTGFIVGGHQRKKALEAGGYTEAQVLVVDFDPDQEMMANLSLNNPRIQGEFTDGATDLLMQYEELYPDASRELMLDALFTDLNGEPHRKTGLTDPNDVPPPPDNPTVKRGEIWIIGDHRLLCGDSTSPVDVARLMDGKKASLLNTDPPYGIAYVSTAQSKAQAKAKEFSEIENDELDGAKLQAFIESSIRSAVPHLIDACPFYLWHPMLTQGTFFAAAAAAAADILISRQIIWVKPSLVFGRGDYHWRHELCFYGWRRGHKPVFYGERNQTTIWQVGRENDGIHPTQKPVELFTRPILNHTLKGEIAYEPFAGSGSQIIAAETFERRCFAIELEPRYCDVIIQRWENFTGNKAVRSTEV